MDATGDVDLDALTDALAALGAVATAPECHGIAAGMLATDPGAAPGPWLAHLLGDEFVAGAEDARYIGVLEALWRQLAAALADTEAMAFTPLLPAAQDDPRARARALVEWVEGYLFGAALVGVPRDEGAEFRRDLDAIVRLDVDAIAADDADEQALEELVEYVRVGVLLAREEVLARRGMGAQEGDRGGAT